VKLQIYRIAAFSDGERGGNPAGVWIGDPLLKDSEMQKAAAEIGFSETAFAAPNGDKWRVRYFSPKSEVPFCGHATIALGAALSYRKGDGVFHLITNAGPVSVKAQKQGSLYFVGLQSPKTDSRPVTKAQLNEGLALFGYEADDLDLSIPPAFVSAGANHLLLCLKSLKKLQEMRYDLEEGRKFMNRLDLVTILLVYAESGQLFHARNPFASGGIYEDPATGAAAAALAGYLRDLDWPHQESITVIQGEDMGMRSVIHASIPPQRGSSILIFGTARFMKY